jgi:hypothetical protein
MVANVTMIVGSIYVIVCDIVLLVVVEEQLQQTRYEPIQESIVFVCVVQWLS